MTNQIQTTSTNSIIFLVFRTPATSLKYSIVSSYAVYTLVIILPPFVTNSKYVFSKQQCCILHHNDTNSEYCCRSIK